MTESQIQYALHEATLEQLSFEIQRRVRNLENKLVTANEAKFNLELAHQEYKKLHLATSHKVFQKCKKAVCQTLLVDFQDIVSKKRKREYVEARQILIYLTRKNSTIATYEMGRLLNVDHSTVLYSEKMVLNARIADKNMHLKLIKCEEAYKRIVETELELKNINEAENL